MQNTFCVFRAFCEPFNFNLLRLKQKSPAVKIQRGFGYARAVIAREALRPKQSPLLNKEIIHARIFLREFMNLLRCVCFAEPRNDAAQYCRCQLPILQ